jgi:hypothetical protein
MTPISMDGTDPAGWDPSLDSLATAPANHRLLYEDESIRVLSVSIAPGQTEPRHHHRWPSVFVIDSLGKKMRGARFRCRFPTSLNCPSPSTCPHSPSIMCVTTTRSAFMGPASSSSEVLAANGLEELDLGRMHKWMESSS